MSKAVRPLVIVYSLVLFAVSLACNAEAASSRDQIRANQYIQPCIAEISKHADYTSGARVVHFVEKLHQKNLVEMAIKVSTVVYAQDGVTISSAYDASCVIASLGEVVKFRIAHAALSAPAIG